MKTSKIGINAALALLTIMQCLHASCVFKSDILGKWREGGRKATIEFFEDGSFKAVDNEGMQVEGKYSVLRRGNIRFEIANEGAEEDVVTMEITVTGDQMRLTPSDGGKFETYIREMN